MAMRALALTLLALFAFGCTVTPLDPGDPACDRDEDEVLSSQVSEALSSISCAEFGDTGYTSGNAFPITVVTVDGKKVEKSTANAYYVMAQAAAAAGVNLQVVSGFRTMAEQTYLYGCYVNCSCNSCNLAAKPGYSNHQSGHALDLNTSSPGVYDWLNAHAGAYGFKRTVPSESWHWEWWGGGPGGGPCGSCKPGCNGSKIIGADCSEGDCGAFGATCANDAKGLRCVSVFCPALGQQKVCINETTVGDCNDGAIAATTCPAGSVCMGGACGHKPSGFLDAASCDGVQGWAWDQDDTGVGIDVHVYFGGPAGSGAKGVATNAGVHREDLCAAIGSCNHGFSLRAPYSLFDDADHEVHAYGINVGVGDNAQLAKSPKTLHCAPSLPDGIKRHVINPDSYAAWKLDDFFDMMPATDAEIDELPAADDWPAAPKLVQGEGDPKVYLLDGQTLRHVLSPASLEAWHLAWGDVEKKTPEEISALEVGPPLPERPLLVRSSSGAVYAVDVPVPLAPPPKSSGDSSAAGGGSDATTGEKSRGGTSGDSGGCSVGGAPRSGNVSWFLLGFSAFVFASWRRRSRHRS